MSAPRTSPYKGLVPYSEEDAPYFFGREAEREIILANLMASRLTLLYGASGVGKSSVLRAGVAHHLVRLAQAEAERGGRPEFLPVVFSDWKDDPVAGLLECVRGTAARVLGADPPPDLPARALGDALHAWAEHLGCDLLVVLDQFEEYFLYHGQEDGPGTFAAELPAAINRRDLRVSFLVSLREDAVAKLDRFKGRIPNLFDNYLRIEHLGREAARAAMEKPLERFNELRGDGGEPVRIEGELVQAALEQLRTGRFALGEAGRGGVPGTGGDAGDDTRIETPFLQLVMTRLWEKEAQAGSRVLRRASLEELGGAGRIVRTHLDKVMEGLSPADQDAASRIFHHLVTPSGTKIAHTPADLAGYTDLPVTRVERVLETLSRGETRVLRSDAPRFEIFHDVLAPAVLDWRRRYLERSRQAEIRRQARRRSLLVSGGLGALLVAAGIAVYMLQRRNETLDQHLDEADVLAEANAALEDQAVVYGQRPTSTTEMARPDTVVPVPAPPPPVGEVLTPTAYGEEARAKRSEIVVHYFQPEILESRGVVDTLRALGFTVEAARGRYDAPPNSIVYGGGVSPAEVERVAGVLVSAGIPVKRIRPFRNPRGRESTIELVHSPALARLPALSEAEVHVLTRTQASPRP